MGWLIALGILLALGCLPLGISGIYEASGPIANLLIGPVKISLYHRKKKKKKILRRRKRGNSPIGRNCACTEKGRQFCGFSSFGQGCNGFPWRLSAETADQTPGNAPLHGRRRSLRFGHQLRACLGSCGKSYASVGAAVCNQKAGYPSPM